jgi:alkanesulfonate monooxygenase SsuD/methylene tetrahydromethanopterin reductase-like flavin-dependent oxidoreductase (luciferase family)
VNLRSGQPRRLPPPVAGFYERLQGPIRGMLDEVLGCSAIGTPETVKARIAAFVERTGADELMITCQMFDHAHRLRSYEIAAHAGSPA